jgi:hypothetical protein
MKFLVENTSNHRVYHIGELLLEKVSVRNLRYQDNMYVLIEIDKLTRQWNKEMTTYNSLVLAKIYSNLATSCTEESKFTDPLMKQHFIFLNLWSQLLLVCLFTIF